MSLLLKNVVFTLVVPGAVGVYAPIVLTRGMPPKPFPGPLVALPLFLLAGFIYIWAVTSFAIGGRGTPLPVDAPKTLVTDGPFRYTRNPMYLALFIALASWTLLYQNAELVLYGLAVAVLVYLFVTRFEEPRLQRDFGRAFETYAASVPRWIPRFRRSRYHG